MTGHWEMMGLNIDKPFKVYPNGFPAELITQLEERIGRKVIGNKPASGIAIIDEFGKEHMETGAHYRLYVCGSCPSNCGT